MMEQLFIKILNLTIKGSWAILAVLVLRMMLKRMPKKYMTVLWAIAGIRLILPFSIQGFFSLIPHAEPIPQNITMMQEPVIHSGFETVDQAVNPMIAETFAPTIENSVNPLQILTFTGALIWIAGIAVMIAYLFFSWMRLRKMTEGAKETEPGVYEGRMISMPFVSGVINPRIYLPDSLDEQSRGDILLHEKMHIARHDTLIRMIAYLILSVHWFNPLVWLARHLFTTDTELACDEAVISRMEPQAQKHYAKTILDFAYHRHSYMPVYASFEEAETKKRILNLVRWKKPTLWTVLGALCVCVITGCGFLSDPGNNDESGITPGQETASDTETLTMEKAVHSADEVPAVRHCEDPALISEFRTLFSELSRYTQKDNDDIIVQKEAFESIPDLILTCGTKVMTLLRQDFSKETRKENMFDAWYVELHDNEKIEKLLLIPANHEYTPRIENIIRSMNSMPVVRNSENTPAVRYIISLIEIPKTGIYCLKEEMIYQSDHFVLTNTDNDEIRMCIGGLPTSYGSVSYPSVSAIDEPAENEEYRRQSCCFIEMNEELSEELFRKLTASTVTLYFQDTETSENFTMEVNPGVAMMSDPDFNPDYLPTPRASLAKEYRVYPDGSDQNAYVTLTPQIRDGILIMETVYVKEGTSYAGSPVMITPDEADVFNGLNRPFKAAIDLESQYFEDGNIHLPFSHGRFGVHILRNQISFYPLNQNDEIITDGGMSYPAFNQ